MKTPPDPSDAERFRDGSKWDIRAVGNKRFFPSVSTRVPKNRGNLDDIIDSCSREMGVERNAVMSRSRQRKLALTRALVAWRAIESGVATLAEVARKLNRDPSTLSVGIKRYKALRPELFKK
jgi:chromosomal replication initiation ATPase DnaA